MEEKEQKEEEEAAADVHALRSVTSKDFNVDDFVPMQPAPTAVSMIFLCFIFLCIFVSRKQECYEISFVFMDFHCFC